MKNQNKAATNTEEIVAKLNAEVESLSEMLEEKANLAAESENKMKKALADYINLENSIQKRVDLSMFQLKKTVAMDVIEIMDDLKFALDAQGQKELTAEVKTWLDGVNSQFSKLNRTLERLGVTNVEVKVGDSFDPSLHEALGSVEEGEPDKVWQVIQGAYLMDGNVIRAARVMVSKGSKKLNFK